MAPAIGKIIIKTESNTSPIIPKPRTEFLKKSIDNNVGQYTDEQKDIEEKVRKELMEFWPEIKADIMSDPDVLDIPQSMAWLETVLEANVPHGKKNQSIAAAVLYRELVPERNKEQEADAYILGWTIEILQAASLMADDMVDGSETRRGKPCWYREPHVGLSAVNDAFLLERTVYEILFRFFRFKPFYTDVVSLLQRSTYRTILGQTLETMLVLEKNIYAFTMDLYWTMVKYKTSYYNYYVPAAAALMIAGIKDPEAYEKLEEIMLELGHYFQIQADYIDCYGDPTDPIQIGTDIVDGKCSWLFVKAMELATEEEQKELNECYGKHDSAMDRKVKEIYKLVELPRAFDEFEENVYAKISKKIQELPACLPKEPIRQALNAIYKRVR